eukprot:scaffold7609_cov112-Isochrysis_galbana.AAC.6
MLLSTRLTCAPLTPAVGSLSAVCGQSILSRQHECHVIIFGAAPPVAVPPAVPFAEGDEAGVDERADGGGASRRVDYAHQRALGLDRVGRFQEVGAGRQSGL